MTLFGRVFGICPDEIVPLMEEREVTKLDISVRLSYRRKHYTGDIFDRYGVFVSEKERKNGRPSFFRDKIMDRCRFALEDHSNNYRTHFRHGEANEIGFKIAELLDSSGIEITFNGGDYKKAWANHHGIIVLTGEEFMEIIKKSEGRSYDDGYDY